MPDEPSNGELSRNIDRLRDDTREDFAALREQIRGDMAGLREQVGAMVSQAQHAADLRTVGQRVDHVESGVAAVRRDQESDRVTARNARQWSIATAIAGAGVLVAVIALFRDSSAVQSGVSVVHVLLAAVGG